VKHALAALRDRHGLDRDTVAAMAFERSRQHKVALTHAFTDLVAELGLRRRTVAAEQSVTGSCVICHAANASVRIIYRADGDKTTTVCEACICVDPASS
jgi:hypothetical protein